MERLNKIIEEIKNKKNELASVKKKPLVLKESIEILHMDGFEKILKRNLAYSIPQNL